MDLGRGEDVGGQPLAQRLQQPGRAADGERRAVEVDAGAGIDQGLPMQRQVIAELGDQHLRQQHRSRPDRPRACPAVEEDRSPRSGQTAPS
jgi:hypothetical protein